MRQLRFHPTAWLLLTLLSARLPATETPTRNFTEMVAQRDGIRLATTVHLPEGEGPWPCVLSRTPYNKLGVSLFAKGFTDRGLALVAQDCRGKFGSEGEYDPFRTDHHDGFDTIAWIAEQDWSNGRVGMWGASALGITSHLAATQRPPALKCAYVIVASASARHNTVYQGGVYRKELNDGWLKGQGAEEAIAETIRHPAGSSHWDWREISDFHARIDIPIYQVGGWFDIFSQGSLDNFTGLQARGAGLAAGNQKLWMGPYAHGALGGRLKFPDGNPAAALDPERALRWFERWLLEKDNGIDREPPVRYYVMGDPEDPDSPGNEWREAVSWPPPSRPTSLFLTADRGLSREIPGAPASISYDYDPADPVPTVGGNNLISAGKGPMDQREIPARQDYLRFYGPVLERPLEIVGRVQADLFVSSDAPDTDFAVKLVDVYPDGYEALILDGIIRVRYRKGLDREDFLEPGQVVPISVDLWSTALVVNRGHRIGVHVTSSNDPRFDPNPNTRAALRFGDEKRVARNTLHLGGRTPSRILLPVTREYPVRSATSSEAGSTDAVGSEDS